MTVAHILAVAKVGGYNTNHFFRFGSSVLVILSSAAALAVCQAMIHMSFLAELTRVSSHKQQTSHTAAHRHQMPAKRCAFTCPGQTTHLVLNLRAALC